MVNESFRSININSDKNYQLLCSAKNFFKKIQNRGTSGHKIGHVNESDKIGQKGIQADLCTFTLTVTVKEASKQLILMLISRQYTITISTITTSKSTTPKWPGL